MAFSGYGPGGYSGAGMSKMQFADMDDDDEGQYTDGYGSQYDYDYEDEEDISATSSEILAL